MKYSTLFGRILFSLIFLMSGMFHFSGQAVAYAAAHGVPFASIVVPLSGVIAVLGGLSIALGYKARWSAWLLVLFLAPVTFLMHNFWAESDSVTAMMQQSMFMKNISILGAALLIAWFGSGPFSLDQLFTKHETSSRPHGRENMSIAA
jgi:putative oxidoreductase